MVLRCKPKARVAPGLISMTHGRWQRLGIPHYVLDYESRFHDKVMQDFADSYLRGETPIPCVRCNQTVKFTDLLATARDLDADCLATGHYVQHARCNRHLFMPWCRCG